jgi:hypothetical protein
MGKGWLIVTLSLLCSLNKSNSTSMTSVRSGFPNRFILDPFPPNALTSLVLLSQIVWIVEFTRPNSGYTSAFFFPLCVFFPFYICCVISNFSSTLKTFVLFLSVAVLSLLTVAVLPLLSVDVLSLLTVAVLPLLTVDVLSLLTVAVLSLLTVAVLSLYQSAVNCRNSNVEGNVTHKINYRYYGHFLGPEFLLLS